MLFGQHYIPSGQSTQALYCEYGYSWLNITQLQGMWLLSQMCAYLLLKVKYLKVEITNDILT